MEYSRVRYHPQFCHIRPRFINHLRCISLLLRYYNHLHPLSFLFFSNNPTDIWKIIIQVSFLSSFNFLLRKCSQRSLIEVEIILETK